MPTGKELCYRCDRVVYPTDKVGPLKDGTFFHHGCFKCRVCGSRLQLRTYYNNRNNIDDKEVYCQNHVPQANPHDPVPTLTPNGHGTNGTANGSTTGSEGHSPCGGGNHTAHQNIGDMQIQHALRATELRKPYPKIVHGGAKYILDYDRQAELEMQHREEEDHMYSAFSRQREAEERDFSEATKEEWELALQAIAAKYEKMGKNATGKKEEVIRQLTVKREKQRETMHHRWRERERAMAAELIEKQSNEMMDLFRQARLENRMEQAEENGHDPSSSPSDQRSNGSYPSTPPPPFPPVGRKRDVYTSTTVFDTVDQTAISVAQAEQETFTELVLALTQHSRNDVEKARAIYRWITVKNLNRMEFSPRMDPNTPMGLLRGIKYGTESYHVLFKRLCSYAGLHCVVIKGFSKSAGYQPGMGFQDGRFRNTWNAVFLDGSWRFVQCNWGARHLVNAKDVPGPGSRVSGRSENLRYEYDDHYFMTDPEEFIYEFYPNSAEWQLLKRPISLQEFEDLPFVRSLFFQYKLGFADPHVRSTVYSDKTGAATIAINMAPAALKSLIFHYNLRHYHTEDQDYNGISLKRFVMQSVVGSAVVFRIHLPCRGDFLADIFANAITPGEYLAGQPMKFKSVCKFKVSCDHLNVIMVPLPECASGEWGPAKAYRLFGLIPLTHEDAIVNTGRDLDIKFQMTRPLLEFVATLHKNSVDDRNLQRFVSKDVRGDMVNFRLSLPEEGQYGLDIYTRDHNTEHKSINDRNLLTHCCKYLINVR